MNKEPLLSAFAATFPRGEGYRLPAADDLYGDGGNDSLHGNCFQSAATPQHAFSPAGSVRVRLWNHTVVPFTPSPDCFAIPYGEGVTGGDRRGTFQKQNLLRKARSATEAVYSCL